MLGKERQLILVKQILTKIFIDLEYFLVFNNYTKTVTIFIFYFIINNAILCFDIFLLYNNSVSTISNIYIYFFNYYD